VSFAVAARANREHAAPKKMLPPERD